MTDELLNRLLTALAGVVAALGFIALITGQLLLVPPAIACAVASWYAGGPS